MITGPKISIKQELKSLLQRDRLETLIDTLNKIPSKQLEKELQEDITMVSSLYHKLEGDKLKGILSPTEINERDEKVRQYLGKIIKDLPEAPTNSPFLSILAIIIGTSIVIALMYIGFSTKGSSDKSQKKETTIPKEPKLPPSTTLTIAIQEEDQNGRLSAPTRGKIVLENGSLSASLPIGSRGYTTFKSLPSTFFTPNNPTKVKFETFESSYQLKVADTLSITIKKKRTPVARPLTVSLSPSDLPDFLAIKDNFQQFFREKNVDERQIKLQFSYSTEQITGVDGYPDRQSYRNGGYLKVHLNGTYCSNLSRYPLKNIKASGVPKSNFELEMRKRINDAINDNFQTIAQALINCL